MSVVPLPTREPFARRSGLPGAYLLDCDPDLGRLLSPARLVDARRQLRVPVAWLARGPWEPRSEGSHAGILIVDGLLMRDVLVADDAAAELLGPGDYLPASPDADRLLPSDMRWTAIAPTQVALLDGGFSRSLLAFPEIALTLLQRQAERTDRLAAQQAIAHLNGVERRILAMLWLCADRWGRMTPDGVVLPLTLRHDDLAHLVGARRPTVSSAMGRLRTRGALRRGKGGGWLLLEPPEEVRSATGAARGRPHDSVLLREHDEARPVASALSGR